MSSFPHPSFSKSVRVYLQRGGINKIGDLARATSGSGIFASRTHRWSRVVHATWDSHSGIRPFATKSHLKARAKKNVEIMVKSDKVVLFTKSNCCRSEAAKRLFDEIKFKYTAVDIDRREDGHFIQSHLGITTGSYYMPRIFIMGACIGGLCELREMHEDGRLLKQLKRL